MMSVHCLGLLRRTGKRSCVWIDDRHEPQGILTSAPLMCRAVIVTRLRLTTATSSILVSPTSRSSTNSAASVPDACTTSASSGRSGGSSPVCSGQGSNSGGGLEGFLLL